MGNKITTNQLGKYSIIFTGKHGSNIDIGSSLKDFLILKELGKGNFGTVFLVKSLKNGKQYAMKEILTMNIEDQKEIKLIKNLQHPHVITYFTSFSENGNLYIIIEYINGSSLDDLIAENIKNHTHIEEKKVWDLLVQSLSGLLYLHDEVKIIHRDIKPDNLLLDSEGNLKISDFGISAVKSENADSLLKFHNTLLGPIQFMAPEVGLGMKYDFKSDIYMLGLTFFYLMNYDLPEAKLKFGPLYIPIKNENVIISNFYSYELKSFIDKLLKKNQDERPSTYDAYKEAMDFYIIKCMKTSCIGSFLFCLNGISKIRNYFLIDIQNKLQNNNEQHVTLSQFVNALMTMDINNFDKNISKMQLFYYGYYLFEGRNFLEFTTEVEPISLINSTLKKLHNKLDKLNNFDISKRNILLENRNIDISNEDSVMIEAAKNFANNFKTKISTYFCYLSKTTYQCNECGNIIKYLPEIYSEMIVYPKRTSIYVQRQDLNVYDLFYHYEKIRGFNEQVYCKYCNMNMQTVNKIQVLYSVPLILVIILLYNKDDQFNLKIDENIDISSYVARKDIYGGARIEYSLIGIIYKSEIGDMIKYCAISKNECNGKWSKYDEENIIEYNFNVNINNIVQGQRPSVLFYKLKT